MAIRFIDEFDLTEKRVFLRLDLNVVCDDNGEITDDTRIHTALPTIQYAIENKGRVILASHLGRPKGEANPKYSLVKVGERLSELLGKEVLFPDNCVGDGVRKLAHDLKEGEVMLLENLRFHKDETENTPEFAKALSVFGDVYINDAFGTCHRAHASTVGMAEYFSERGAGFLVKKELEHLRPLLDNPEKPYIGILGGAKVSDKIDVIGNLLNKVDGLLIGGAMAYTFLAAKGIKIGNSLIEPEKLNVAERILERADNKDVPIYLPVDHVVAKDMHSESSVTPTNSIPDGMMGFDIGPKTLQKFTEVIQDAKTVFWNGPLGMFEVELFSRGTLGVTKVLATSSAKTITGGGDSIAAIKKTGLADKFAHLSTGGGATLEFLEGKVLPGLKALEI